MLVANWTSRPPHFKERRRRLGGSANVTSDKSCVLLATNEMGVALIKLPAVEGLQTPCLRCRSASDDFVQIRLFGKPRRCLDRLWPFNTDGLPLRTGTITRSCVAPNALARLRLVRNSALRLSHLLAWARLAWNLTNSS